ncbi:sigma-70 family RNA polymerase sigma factor [Streptacidiphilus albus]|uniref:sigma-70 family RNA polymerase sigma factor n=1 Tax=Streptacidiphilus albus TaxID=105425 RepID=UPI00068F828E|nr:sigma-70 family RNA polymerase sigma factor [Streptacidiphilus albus]
MRGHSWTRFGSEPLETVEREFRSLSEGAGGLLLEVGDLGGQLPQEPLDMVELRALLLHPSLDWQDRGLIWGRLLVLAQEPGRAGEQWRLAATGMVMPGLRRAASRLCPQLPEHNEDLQQAMLVGLWEALAGLVRRQLPDPVRTASRLVWAADRAGRAYRNALLEDERRCTATEDAGELGAAPRQPVHPDVLLALAVRQGVVDVAEAELIGRTRLGGEPTRTVAEQLGISQQAVAKRRLRAERRLIRAITSGELAFEAFEQLIER